MPPSGFNARPTTDFAKVALFNIIATNFDIERIEVLDLFAGTGSISFEFASRGCPKIDLVELNAKHHAFIAKTADTLKFSQIHAIKNNAFTFLTFCKASYDIIFADPPYEIKGIEQIPEEVFVRNLLKPDGWLIVEHSKDTDLSAHPHFVENRHYGSVNFSFFK